MNRRHAEAAPFQVAGYLIDALLGFTEYDYLIDVQIHNQPLQQVALLGGVDGDDVLLDAGAGRILRRGLHLLGTVHEILRQLADGRRESGGKQQGLALFGQKLHDGADVVDEAHVEHAVGFVEHHDFHFIQPDVFLLHVIQQPAHGGHHDFAAGAQVGGLFVHIHAAEQHGVAQRQVFDVGGGVLVDLVGQFAGGGEHQHAHRVHGGRGAGGGVAAQALQAGQHEGGGFAGAGLGGGQQIVSGQYFGDGSGLDGGGLLVALVGQRGGDFGGKAEIGEGIVHICSVWQLHDGRLRGIGMGFGGGLDKCGRQRLKAT